MANGGSRRSREAILLAHDRERQVVQLFIRGLTFTEIAKQLALADHTSARRAFERAAKRIPKKETELLRKLQSERLDAMRRRIFTELAGREKEISDPDNPGRPKRVTVQPEVGDVGMLIGRLLAVEQREADLYGLDAPKKSEIMGALKGQRSMTPEELDLQLARLTPAGLMNFRQ
jgi:hypothetical protein